MSLEFWIENLTAYSIQIAVIILTAAALPPLLGLRVPAVRLAYWHSLLGACLLLPVLQPWSDLTVNPVPIPGDGAVSVHTTVLQSSAAHPAFFLPGIILATVAAGIVIRLAWLAVGLCRLRRFLRHARDATKLPPGADRMRNKLATRARFYFSQEVASPVTFGAWRPVILLPHSFLKMPESEQSAIACHEICHARRQDWLCVLAEEMIAAFLWFHPAIWWLLGQIHLAREQTVDRQVLALMGQREAYLSALLRIAGGSRSVPIPAPLFLREKHLLRRVNLILKEVRMSPRQVIASTFAAIVITLIGGLLAIRAFPLQSLRAEPSFQQRIQGEVYDPAGNPVPGVQVSLVLPQTKQVLVRAVTDRMGRFEIASPGPTEFQLLLERPGFKLAVYTSDQLSSGPLRATLQLGEVTESLEVRPTPKQESSSEPAKRTPSRVGGRIKAPKPIRRVNPDYPREAKEKGIEGRVVLEMTVNEKGEVSEARVVSGHSLLDGAALEAVLKWRFSPAMDGETPVAVLANAEIQFSLKGEPQSPSAEQPSAPIRVGSNVQEAKLIHKVQPLYPPEAKEQRIEGAVILQVNISREGDVTDVRVMSGHPLLADAAAEAVRQWKYQPTFLNGVPVAVVATVTVVFRLG